MDKKQITPQIIMATLLSDFPGTAEVLIEHRMACVGCNMAAFETLEDAAHIYGIALNELLEALRQAVYN
jgi:hybrid cluster-associated redox disulfide protein